MHRHERARVWLPRHDPLDCRGHLARSDTHTATDSGATLAGDTLAARSPPAALGSWREVPSSRALRDAGLGGRIRARWPSVFLNDSLGSTPPSVEPSAFSQCSTSPTACLCNRDKKERQHLQAHSPRTSPTQPADAGRSAHHLARRLQARAKQGAVARFGGMRPRHHSRSIDAARRKGLAAMMLKFFGLT